MFKFEKKLKNLFYINAFFLLFLFGCKKQSINPDLIAQQTEIEKKLSELNAKKYDSLVRNEYEKLILLYYNKQGIEYYYIAKDFQKNAARAKDTLGTISSLTNLGQYFFNKSEADSSYLYYTKAEKLSTKLTDNPYLGAILFCKANLLWKQKNYSESQVVAVRALKIAQDKRYYDDATSSLFLIGNSLMGMNKSEQAIAYYINAFETLNKIPESEVKETLKLLNYINLAMTYQKLSNNIKTIEYIDKAFKYKNLKKDHIIYYSYLKNILAKSIYKTQKVKALSIYAETLKIGDSLNFAPIQVASQLQLGEYYFFYKDTLKANAYLQKAKKLAHQNKIFEDELIVLKLLAKSIPEKSHYYSDRYIHLNDSLHAVERATRDKFARIEFETDEIANQKNHFEKENKKLTAQLLIAIGFALLLLLSLYLWFKNKSNKAKINELKLIQEKQELKNNELLFIQEQQRKDEKMYQLLLHQQDKIEEGKQAEKIRISRELHDGIMGKLSGIRLNLYVLKKKTDPETIAKCLEFVKEIQMIENELRLLSHDLNKESLSTIEGIENEINTLFKEIKNHQNIDFTLIMDPHIVWENIKYTVKLAMYRIIQEALHNIDKYAQAKNVVVTIAQTEAFLSIEIKDNGVGFDLTARKEGIGLKNMRERTEEMGGLFSITSLPEKGTKINLQLPQ